MKLTLQQLEAHLWGAANILRGKTAGQDYTNYILALMFYKRLCDQWECEADDAITEQERQQGRAFSEQEKACPRRFYNDHLCRLNSSTCLMKTMCHRSAMSH